MLSKAWATAKATAVRLSWHNWFVGVVGGSAFGAWAWGIEIGPWLGSVLGFVVGLAADAGRRAIATRHER